MNPIKLMKQLLQKFEKLHAQGRMETETP